MTETLIETQNRQQTVDITSIQKDIEFMKESMTRNFTDHEDIKKLFKESLGDKVSKSRFRPTELITYGLAGGVMLWALNQLLELIGTAKAFFN
jgi:hypothetical protein